MKYWPKNKTGKYPFLDYFKGDWAVWLKKDSNFKQMMSEYPDLMKRLDEHRYEKLFHGYSNATAREKIPHLLSTAIDEGNKFESLARKGLEEKYPGIEIHNFDGIWDEALEGSLQLIDSEKDFIAYEPYFQFNPVSQSEADELGIDIREFNFKTRVDALIRKNGVFFVYEMKGSTSAKLDYAFDLFYQWKILQKNKISISPANMKIITIDNRFQKNNEFKIWTEWDGFLDKKPYRGKPENHNEVLDWYKKSIKFDHRFINFIPTLDRTINFTYVAKKIVSIQMKNLSDLSASNFLNESVEESFGKKSDSKYRRGFRFFGDDFGGDYYEELYMELMGLNIENSILELNTTALSFEWRMQLALKGQKEFTKLQPHQLLTYYETQQKLGGDQEKAKEYAFNLFKKINEEKKPVNNKGLEQIFSETQNKELIDIEKLRKFTSEIKYPVYFIRFNTTRVGILDIGDFRPFEEILLGYTIGIKKNESAPIEYIENIISSKNEIVKIYDRLSDDLMTAGIGTWTSLRYSMDKTIFDRAIEEKWPEDIGVFKLVRDNLINLGEPFKIRAYYSKEFKGNYDIYSLSNKYSVNGLSEYRKERMQNFGKRWIISQNYDDLWKAVTPSLKEITREEINVMSKSLQELKK